MCPAGTFWDGSQCNFINAVRCPNAPCDASTPAGTRYPSGRCCNKYFECSNSQLVEVSCPVGQYFDSGYRQCLTATDSIQVCERTGRFECDVNRNGPISAVRCDGFAPDPFANPCRFQFQGRSMNVAPGTVWNQNKCALEYSNNNVCYNTLINTRLLDLSSTCNAVFLATFNGGSKSVYSERLNANLDIYVLQNQVQLTNDGLLYTSSMSDPFYYFYFFNNREIRPNTAFRIRFRLDNPQFNREYDILSNNYCALCPDTIRFSVSASSSTRRVVSVMFVTPGALVTSTSAIIDLSNVLNLIELVVIFGDRAVYGQLRELNGVNFNNIVQRVDFNSANKVQGSQVATNRCGIQLGRGPNSNFVGIIDDFAVYERCVNINSVLS
ncbi:hypothetical protein Btru_072820 [Bulinus truncatus]|nr:hypothetical protein Btru_072820 [Bulinus truncatus]